LVTSLRKAQGKSFFIIALAHSLSLLKKRVLIIDTNLRNNSLTRLFLAQPNFALMLDSFKSGSRLLGGHNGETGEATPPSPVERNLITRTKNSFIDIIGNKKTQLSPAEIIPGGDFKVLLEWFKGEYDYILLEGPGLNSYSDTKELIKFVDLVIPMFSADSTIDNQDIESLNFLKSLSLRLGAAVLNNVQPVN
jgi:Mrp family chromosome partitioning ATPase